MPKRFDEMNEKEKSDFAMNNPLEYDDIMKSKGQENLVHDPLKIAALRSARAVGNKFSNLQNLWNRPKTDDKPMAQQINQFVAKGDTSAVPVRTDQIDTVRATIEQKYDQMLESAKTQEEADRIYQMKRQELQDLNRR